MACSKCTAIAAIAAIGAVLFFVFIDAVLIAGNTFEFVVSIASGVIGPLSIVDRDPFDHGLGSFRSSVRRILSIADRDPFDHWLGSFRSSVGRISAIADRNPFDNQSGPFRIPNYTHWDPFDPNSGSFFNQTGPFRSSIGTLSIADRDLFEYPLGHFRSHFRPFGQSNRALSIVHWDSFDRHRSGGTLSSAYIPGRRRSDEKKYCPAR